MEKPLQCKPCVPGAAARRAERRELASPQRLSVAALPVLPCRSSSSSSIPTCLGIGSPACCGRGGTGRGVAERGLSRGANAVALSPGAEDVRGQADAAAAPGFPGLRAGLGGRVRHGGDPLRRGAGGHAAVRLRGQGLLLQ